MKITFLFRRLTNSIQVLLAIVVALLILDFVEVFLTFDTTHKSLHAFQLVLFVVLIGLGWWVLTLNRILKEVSQFETNLLKEKLSEQDAQLQLSHQQISDIIEASPDLVWAKDLQGVYTSANLAFAKYIGFDMSEILGKTDFDLTTREQAEMFRAHDRQTMALRKATTIEEQHAPANGQAVLLFEIIKTPLYDAAGQVIGVQGIGRDITQRRATEVALAHANEQRRMLEICINQLNDVVVITEAEPFDKPGPRILFVNDAYERMTGYSRAETIGESPRKLQGPKTQRSELERMRQALTKWKSVHVELINYKKSGEEFWVEIDVVPVADATGWFTHWVAVQRDITARKIAEAELLYVCDRALEASRLKSEFLGSISHEMRTPMNAVMGMATLLLTTELNPKQTVYAQHILSAGQDYMQVIDKSLDFSQLESGQMVLEQQPFALIPLLQASMAQVTPKAELKQLKLSSQVDANLPLSMHGDARRLTQCLLILLDNAVKFTAEGSVTLEVQRVPGAESSVRFTVRDTGIGLTASDRERLFRPFVQGDGSVTRRYGGIGLGLVICQQLITLMQGRMGVGTDTGHGSAFWFELPLESTR